jgi:hypothetical protein
MISLTRKNNKQGSKNLKQCDIKNTTKPTTTTIIIIIKSNGRIRAT